VEAVAKAVEWGRATPREQVIARLKRILHARKRNENDELLKHWRPAAARTKGGVLTERDFSIWIDWLVKEGQLKPGQIEPGGVFTNQFNPYSRSP
jgi:ABC-type nitrate/sulfonate/bicarbonate transport system substrate-binding protein